MNTSNSTFSKTFENLDAAEFESGILKDPETVILDVRTEEEFLSGHIPGALSLDITGGNFSSTLEKLDKMKSYYVYCRSGARSASACYVMAKTGFQKVYNLEGGIMSYEGKIES